MSPDHAPHTQPPGATKSSHNAALLIDFDNVTMGIRSDLQNQLRKLLSSEVIRARVAVQRAYADWRRYPQYIAPLSEASIDLIFAPAFGSNKKNATDIRLAIDALELVFTRPEIGTFILLSGDSDFSSLVLKLKEYGKFVIGVGIRESASDLLVQNCNEYYSYSELTGLSRQVEGDALPRDPWELVVEAVNRMESQRDVMRSDRLKQVMQELDPHFDEKDAGYNKFSKFVLESARRGLVRLEKMDNGQFEVALGPDANPSLSAGRAASEVNEETEEKRSRFQGSAERSALGKSGMVLADALALLKRTLRDLGAFGDESTETNQARERMIDLAENASDPILDAGRFHRLLRQAHDASIVELVKTEDERYFVKLMPDAASPVQDRAVSEMPEMTTITESEEQSAPPKKKRAKTKKKATKKKKATTKTQAAANTAEAPSAEIEPTETKKESTKKKSTAKKKAAKTVTPAPEEPSVNKATHTSVPSRPKSMGMRSGSRGGIKRDLIPSSGEAQDDRSALRKFDDSLSGRRSLQARPGGRSARKPGGANQEEPAKPVVEAPQPDPTASRSASTEPDAPRAERPKPSRSTEPDVDRGEKAKVAPRQRPTSKTKAEPGPKRVVNDSSDEEGGLFKRMGAALHRAVLGDEDE